MGGEKIPTNQPEKLNDLLKQERRDYDCTPCRIVGKSSFLLTRSLWLSLTHNFSFK